jgi:ABC-type uncharacterized transport system YnjBCD permease subunit
MPPLSEGMEFIREWTKRGVAAPHSGDFDAHVSRLDLFSLCGTSQKRDNDTVKWLLPNLLPEIPYLAGKQILAYQHGGEEWMRLSASLDAMPSSARPSTP